MLPLNSGQQTLQLQITNVTEENVAAAESNIEKTNAALSESNISSPDEQQEKSEKETASTLESSEVANEANQAETISAPESSEVAKKANREETILAPESSEVADEKSTTTADPAALKNATEITTVDTAAKNQMLIEEEKAKSEIATAKNAKQKATVNTVEISDAMLKAELFEKHFHLDLPAPPAPEKTATKEKPTAQTVNAKKVRTMVSSTPSPSNATEPAVSNELTQKQEKAKQVFKKQPQEKVASVQERGVLQEAIVVSGNKPIYPKRAILRNEQGRVVIKLTVSTRGKAKNPEILTSSGHPVLDDAVLDFIAQELFMPAHQGEEKITTEQIFSFRFELK
ncbi:energy transducer TonB [Psychromonas antarctica]|uniref:energy transducer TonB n=1 Tax=Psychromonas antarctica TaxID=67573 RepID=UPI001EE7AFBE|nr:energy transducer TonB [Psychromonas antarctica]MCG6201636.1 TonB family protein [Psychromonas antarctica]